MATTKTPVIEVVIRDEVTAALERSRQRMRHADSGFNFKGLTAGLGQLGNAVQGLSRQLGSITGLGALLGGGFVAGMARATNALGELSRSTLQMNSTAESLGLTAKQFEGWVARGQLLGQSVEQSKAGVTSLAQLIDKLVVFGPRAAQFAEVYKGLGGPEFLNQVRSAAQTGGTQAGIEAYLQGLSRVKDRRAQTALAEFAGLGPGWQNAAKLDASKLGNIYQLNASDAAKYNLEMLKLKMSFSNVSKEVAVAVMPAMTSMITAFDKFVQGPGADLAKKFGSWLASIDIDWDKVAKNLIGLIDAASRFVTALNPIVEDMGGWTPILVTLGAAIGLAGLGGGLKVVAAGLAAIGAVAWVVPMLVAPANAAEAQQQGAEGGAAGSGTSPPAPRPRPSNAPTGGSASGPGRGFRRRGAPAPTAADEGDGTSIPENAQPRSGGPGGQGFYVPGHGYIKTNYETKRLREQVREVRVQVAHLGDNIAGMGLVSDDTGAGGLAALGGVFSRLSAPMSGAPGGSAPRGRSGQPGGPGGGPRSSGSGPGVTDKGETPAHFANVRYNNPGAMYPGASARKFGTTGTGKIGGGHLIANFPTPVHGAAANMDNLQRGYVGMTISAAMRKWSGGYRSIPGPGGAAYPPNMVITREMANDPNFIIPFMRAVTSGEGKGRYPMDDAQWQQAFRWYQAGGAPAGEAALPRNKASADMQPAVTTSTDPNAPVTATPPAGQPLPDGSQGKPAPTRGPDGQTKMRGGSAGVHPALWDVVQEASKSLPEGWTARIESGNVPRSRGGEHPKGNAADVRIYDEKGNMVGGSTGWYQNPATFRLYEQFAQSAKAAQLRKYPNGNFVWGGYFLNRGPGSYGFADLMHMQWGGPMAGGTWEKGAHGITRQWLERGGGVSAGMGPGLQGGGLTPPVSKPSPVVWSNQDEIDALQKGRENLFTRARERNVGLTIRVRGPRGVKVTSDSSGSVAPAVIERSMDATGGGRIQSPA